jgi:dTDP-4-amino-4,6-dideoxygalactose transaminase
VSEDVDAVLDCLRSGWLTMGPRTERFEDAFADWTGSPHAIAVSSEVAAIHIALAAIRIGPGMEVIVPAVGGERAADAVRRLGAVAVTCGVVSSRVPTIDVLRARAAITPRTRAVVAVHLAGHPADVVLLREMCDRHDTLMVEDATAALGTVVDGHGRQAGTVGDVGAFGLSDGRQLSVGEGGMVAAGSMEHAARARLLRSHAMTSGTWDRHRGHSATYDIVDVGYNARLDEPRAALGTARLPRVAAGIEARRRTALAYRDALSGSPATACFDAESAPYSSHGGFLVLVEDPAAVAERLAGDGVNAARVGDWLLELPVGGIDEDAARRIASLL